MKYSLKNKILASLITIFYVFFSFSGVFAQIAPVTILDCNKLKIEDSKPSCRVTDGDTVGKIAKSLGIKETDICGYTSRDANTIAIGEILKIGAECTSSQDGSNKSGTATSQASKNAPSQLNKNQTGKDAPATQLKTAAQKNEASNIIKNYDNKSYHLLTPLPGIGNCDKDQNCSIAIAIDNGNDSAITDYMSNIYNLGIGIAIALAVVMIIIGGINYATTELIQGKSDAKNMIQNAFLGLIFALVSYLFLYILNPDLVKFGIGNRLKLQERKVTEVVANYSNITEAKKKAADTERTLNEASANWKKEEDATLNILKSGGITVKGNRCSIYNDSRTTIDGKVVPVCTSVYRLPDETINELKLLKQKCDAYSTNCNIIITGGTEAGHSTHGPGKIPVDLRKGIENKPGIDTDFDKFIFNEGTKNPKNPGGVGGVNGAKMSCVAGMDHYLIYGALFALEADGVNTHWHLCSISR